MWLVQEVDFQLQIYSKIGSRPLNHMSTSSILSLSLVPCLLTAVGGSKNGDGIFYGQCQENSPINEK